MLSVAPARMCNHIYMACSCTNNLAIDLNPRASPARSRLPESQSNGDEASGLSSRTWRRWTSSTARAYGHGKAAPCQLQHAPRQQQRVEVADSASPRTHRTPHTTHTTHTARSVLNLKHTHARPHVTRHGRHSKRACRQFVRVFFGRTNIAKHVDCRVQAGLHCAFNTSRHISPVLGCMFGWHTA